MSDEPRAEPRAAIDGPVSIGVRRVRGLDLDAPLPESDPRLVDRISEEIRANGPMTFARFMELALYDPDAGYYTGQRHDGAGPGRQADFLTAPEGHPIFGWAIARQVEKIWDRLERPQRFVVREHGSGTGALAIGLLDGLRRSKSPLFEVVRYQAGEVAPARAAVLRERLEDAGLADRREDLDLTPSPGVVIANEVLDALPVHRVEGAPVDRADGPLLERFVDLADDGSITTALGPPSTPDLAGRLTAEGVTLLPGQPAEICLAIEAFIGEAALPLSRGLMLLIDYGGLAPELYAPTRGSTLRAYHRHRVHDDPFVAIGRQDLTAHVDLTAVGQAAIAAGLEPVGRTTQARFLADLGLGELLVDLQSAPGTTLEAYLEARSAVARMLDPRATGNFTVLGFGRGLPEGDPSLLGFRSAG